MRMTVNWFAFGAFPDNARMITQRPLLWQCFKRLAQKHLHLHISNFIPQWTSDRLKNAPATVLRDAIDTDKILINIFLAWQLKFLGKETLDFPQGDVSNGEEILTSNV